MTMDARRRVEDATREALAGHCSLVAAETIPLDGGQPTYSVWISGVAGIRIDGVHRTDLPWEDPAYGGDGLRAGPRPSLEEAWEALYAMLQRVTRCLITSSQSATWDPRQGRLALQDTPIGRPR